MRGQKVKFFMNNRSILSDQKATEQGGQVITELLGGAAIPVRQPTGAWQFRANNRAPSKIGSEHIETVDPVAHQMDPWFLSWGAKAIWESAYEGLGAAEKKSADFLQNRWTNIIVAVAGICFAFAALGISQVGNGPETREEPQRAAPALPPVQQELQERLQEEKAAGPEE